MAEDLDQLEKRFRCRKLDEARARKLSHWVCRRRTADYVVRLVVLFEVVLLSLVEFDRLRNRLISNNSEAHLMSLLES